MNEVITKENQEAADQEKKQAFKWDDYWSEDTYKNVLPEDVDMGVFTEVCKRALRSTPNLSKCAKSNPQKVLDALIECAQDGLMPDGKEAALVCFKNNRNNTFDLIYMPMVRGVVLRLYNSGIIFEIRLRMVFENDMFKRIQGDDEKYLHEPCDDGECGDPKGVYAIVKTIKGAVFREYMPAKEVLAIKAAAIRKVGGPKNSYKTPWGGDFEFEMWKKSVLKRIAKILPLSSTDKRMMDRDNSLYDLESLNVATIEKPKFMRLGSEPEGADTEGDTLPEEEREHDNDPDLGASKSPDQNGDGAGSSSEPPAPDPDTDSEPERSGDDVFKEIAEGIETSEDPISIENNWNEFEFHEHYLLLSEDQISALKSKRDRQLTKLRGA